MIRHAGGGAREKTGPPGPDIALAKIGGESGANPHDRSIRRRKRVYGGQCFSIVAYAYNLTGFIFLSFIRILEARIPADTGSF